MKKDVAYSMRMPSRVREALKEAARMDHRSVASLLDKIVADYLTKEGFLRGPEFGTEKRRFPRKKITLPVKTFMKAGSEEKVFPCAALDISMGGALVTYPKGSKMTFTSIGERPLFKLCFEHPQANGDLCFNCETRHMRDTGDEIQIGASFNNPNEKCLKKLNSYYM